MAVAGGESREALVRVKTSDIVAERLIEMLFAGELRAGDRIDLDAIATRFGVSRAPVREALLALERDGIVEVPYHRGAFVSRFDGSTVREAFELYALLSALTTGRVALSHDDEVLARLTAAGQEVEAASRIETFERAAREFRRIVNTATAGPHLRALLRTFSGLVPVASRLSMDRSLDAERRLIAQELAGIQAGDVQGARAAAIEHVRMLCDTALSTLREHGVIGAEQAQTNQDGLAEMLSMLEAQVS
jgi:DNA-binding GntR family transcriptional regulator